MTEAKSFSLWRCGHAGRRETVDVAHRGEYNNKLKPDPDDMPQKGEK